MNTESGSKDYPIWLIGDSNPAKWEQELDDPLDSRHPARHNIWTPILERIQSRLFKSTRKRLQIDDLYVRNAIQDSSRKPRSNKKEWPMSLEEDARELIREINTHQPKLVLSFGAFAFEFLRRGFDDAPYRAFGYWSAMRLGEEFERRMKASVQQSVQPIPLLHVSIARGRFLSVHKNFTTMDNGNYFDYVGERIADFLQVNDTDFPIA